MDGDQRTPKSLGRRELFQFAAVGATLASAAGTAAAAVPSVTAANITTQPTPNFADDPNTSDIIVETLIVWGVTHVFGVDGDGINPLIEALRKLQDELKAAADILNSGARVAIFAGQGALTARDEVTQLADMLGAPVAKALLGKAVLPPGCRPRSLRRRQVLVVPRRPNSNVEEAERYVVSPTRKLRP